MNRKLQPARALYGIGLMGLGVLALVYRDFALDWQPVPDWVPGRGALTIASGVLMLATGLGLLFRAFAVWATRLLLPYFVLWILLKVRLLYIARGMEAVWLGFGEVVMITVGTWILWAATDEIPAKSILSAVVGNRGLEGALVAFGLAVLPVGLSHLTYVPETVGLVPG